MPADHSAQTGLSDTMAPGADQRAVAVRRRRVSRRLRGRRCRRRRDRYWRGPVLSRFDGRKWTLGQPQDRRQCPRPRRAASIVYTVTLEPHATALAVRARPAVGACRRPRRRRGRSEHRACDRRSLTRDQQLLIARAGDAAAALLAALGAARPPIRRTSRFDGRAPICGCPDAATRARSRSRASCAHASRRRARSSTPCSTGSTARISSTRWRRRCSTHESGRRVPVRHAARLLRALRERVRRDAARRGHSGARGHRLSGRHDQSARRLHDRAPVRRARVGGGAGRRQWRRFDPTAAVRRRASSSAGRRAARGRAVPLLARLDGRGSRTLQLTWDAINHDWRRNVVGFNLERQRALWREWQLDVLAPWQIAALVGAGRVRVGRRSSRLARCGGGAARSARCVLWDDLCRRLARAGLPRAPLRRAARLRAARGAALAAVRDRVRGHRRVVRGAALRRSRRRSASATRWSRRSSARSRCCPHRAALPAMPTLTPAPRSASGASPALMPRRQVSSRIHRLALPADLEVQLHLSASVLPISAIFWPARDLLAFLHQDLAGCARTRTGTCLLCLMMMSLP